MDAAYVPNPCDSVPLFLVYFLVTHSKHGLNMARLLSLPISPGFGLDALGQET